MGVVWKAESTKKGRGVVVKEPLISADHDDIKIERLLIESAVLRTINDELTLLTSDLSQRTIRKHSVRFVDQYGDPFRPLLVLELLDGPTMNSAYRGRPLDEKRALREMARLLAVVEALHSAGVVHRDISPGNVILHPKRGPVLFDFGASIFLRGKKETTASGDRVVFKRGYSAPELLNGRSDERTDVFSAGATMLFLLTGKSPTDLGPEPSSDLIDRVCKSRGFSDEITQILCTAMSLEPKERYRSAAEMLRAVQNSPL